MGELLVMDPIRALTVHMGRLPPIQELIARTLGLTRGLIPRATHSLSTSVQPPVLTSTSGA